MMYYKEMKYAPRKLPFYYFSNLIARMRWVETPRFVQFTPQEWPALRRIGGWLGPGPVRTDMENSVTMGNMITNNMYIKESG